MSYKLFLFSLFFFTFIPVAMQMTCFKINGVLGCDAMIQNVTTNKTGKTKTAEPVECQGEFKLCIASGVNEEGNAELLPYQTDGCVQNRDGTFHYDTTFRRGNVGRHCELILSKNFNQSFCCCEPSNNACNLTKDD